MYRKILIVVDDRPETQVAIRQGVEMALVHRADVLFFHVLPRYVFSGFDMLPVSDVSPEEFRTQAYAHAHAMLAAASELAERAGVQSHRAIGTGNDDAQCVSDAADKRHCDLSVVATEERNAIMRILNGSIIPGLITVATVPVLICRDTAGPIRRGVSALRARQRRLELSERRTREDND
jgi:nucleotide-binding universal stress UspA family protein